MRLAIFLLLLPLCGALTLQAQDLTGLQGRTVIGDLDSPTQIVWGPDDRIWMAERYGRVSRLDPETGELEILDIVDDVNRRGFEGLTALAVSGEPGAVDLFLLYSSKEFGDCRVVRYSVENGSLSNPRPIVTGLPINASVGYGGFEIRGDHLYIGVGLGATGPTGQDLSSAGGKILRVNLDGTIPPDNPWAGAPPPTNAIWSRGHMNPQGLAFGPTGILYETDRGSILIDELNIIERGGNYGAPFVEGVCDRDGEQGDFCRDSGIVDPAMAWDVRLYGAGLTYYGSELIKPWQGSLLMVCSGGTILKQLRLSEDGRSVIEEQSYFYQAFGRLRDICTAPDGRVFIATGNREGSSQIHQGADRIVQLYFASDVPTIGMPELEGSHFCSEESVGMSFSATGTFFPENKFVLLRSDTLGRFGEHSSLFGTTTGQSGGHFEFFVFGRGSGYRFRVISTSPYVEGAVLDRDISISVPWRANISASGKLLCSESDSVVLTGSFTFGDGEIVEYEWSNQDGPLPETGLTLVVREPGNYSLSGVDSYGCPTSFQPFAVTKGVEPVVEIVSESAEFCEGDSLELRVSGFGASNLEWSDGSTGNALWVKEEGSYWVEGKSDAGCVSRSEEFIVTKLAAPPTPVISREGNLLTGPEGYAYQWYRNSLPLPNATERTLTADNDGTYILRVENAAGCGSLSEPLTVMVTGVAEEQNGEDGNSIAILPHPVQQTLRVTLPKPTVGSVRVTVTDIGGRIVLERMVHPVGNRIEVPVEMLAPGMYALQLIADDVRYRSTYVKR